MRKRMIAAIVGTALLALPVVVLADTKSKDLDRGDGPLAIDRWEVSHLDDGVVRHTITFASNWDSSILAEDGDELHGDIEFRFRVWDRDGDVVNEVAPIELNDDGTLKAELKPANVDRQPGWVQFNAQSATFGHLNVWRPDARTLQAEFHPRILNQKKWPYQMYKWAVASVYVDDREGSENCRTFVRNDDGSITVIDPGGCRNKTFFIRHKFRN